MRCYYQDCNNQKLPFSKITFFNLPKDYRRQVWIENSGNPSLKLINPNSVRMFCEEHFDKKDLRKQFMRTILHKNAVPYKYNASAINEENCLQSSQGTETTEYNSHLYITPDEEHVSEQELENKETESISEDEDFYFEIKVSEHAQNTNESERLEVVVHRNEILEEDNNAAVEAVYNNDFQISAKEAKKPNQKIVKPVQSIQKRCRLEVLEETSKDFVKIKNEAPKVKTVNPIYRGNTLYNEDEHFALSLVGYLQRLPDRTKSRAKLKILEYLTDLEYCSSIELK